MRARDYDSQTGLFLSRDAVDVQQQGVEAFNPYQFAFNNPLVYSDPTGLFTIVEINGTLSAQDALEALKTYSGQQAKEYVKQKLGDAFGNVVLKAFESFLPGINQLSNILSPNFDFEDAIKDSVCRNFEGFPLKDNLFIEVKINDGIPQDNGFNCSRYNSTTSGTPLRVSLLGSAPDFLFRNSLPQSYKSKDSGAYLVGDIKFYLGAARNAIYGTGRTHNQYVNMVKYAQKYQLLPFVSYLALYDSNIFHNPASRGGDPSGLSDADKARLAGTALAEGIILILANLIDR
jgi:hypothetical protein